MDPDTRGRFDVVKFSREEALAWCLAAEPAPSLLAAGPVEPDAALQADLARGLRNAVDEERSE
jgi:hypothetical protein